MLSARHVFQLLLVMIFFCWNSGQDQAKAGGLAAYLFSLYNTWETIPWLASMAYLYLKAAPYWRP